MVGNIKSFVVLALLMVSANQLASHVEWSNAPAGFAEPRSKAIPGKFDVASEPGGACPASHPIKGNFTTYSGEACIFHLPTGKFYNETRAERCYANIAEAEADSCRASKK